MQESFGGWGNRCLDRRPEEDPRCAALLKSNGSAMFEQQQQHQHQHQHQSDKIRLGDLLRYLQIRHTTMSNQQMRHDARWSNWDRQPTPDMLNWIGEHSPRNGVRPCIWSKLYHSTGTDGTRSSKRPHHAISTTRSSAMSLAWLGMLEARRIVSAAPALHSSSNISPRQLFSLGSRTVDGHCVGDSATVN